MTVKKKQLVMNFGYYMLQGNTYDECAEEYGISRKTVIRWVERLKEVNLDLFCLIKNKPYMVFQRAIYKRCSIEEARKVFRVSQKEFDKFLMSVYKDNPRKYVKMRTKLYQANYVADK